MHHLTRSLALALTALTIATVSFVPTATANPGAICGVLDHVSGGPYEKQTFVGARHGFVTVNFSKAGKIVARQTVTVNPGQYYEFTPQKGAEISISCGRL